jgi:cytochrome d ubiquinol oxidase subunit II
MDLAYWLPVIFVVLMGVAVFVYVILDGYDLGVGVLMAKANEKERDAMIASIGPFWDANETWLVLSVGLLLVAFPLAHGIILTALYLPVVLMLFGIILRGVSFEFRAKVKEPHKIVWDRAFIFGSFLTTLMQGYMLGAYIIGFNEYRFYNILFILLVGLCLVAGYCLVGASWLIMKTEGELQKKAVGFAKVGLIGTSIGMLLVSIATPMVSHRVYEKWFTMPNIFFLSPLPIITLAVIVCIWFTLQKLPMKGDKKCWVPFLGSVLLFFFGLIGLAYSFFPFIVPDQIDIWQASSSVEALTIILIGALIVLPFIIVYTAFAYKVFWGKVKDLKYY